jgi:hypothetical protein
MAFKKLTKPTSNSFSFTVSSGNQRHILWSLDSNVGRTGMYAIYTNASGGVGYVSLSPGSYSVSVSGNTITFTYSSDGNPIFIDMIATGSPMAIS